MILKNNIQRDSITTDCFLDERSKIRPDQLLYTIKKYIDKNTIIVVDGSNAMFWAVSIFEAIIPGQIIIGPDGMLGPMGCGVALAIGAKIAAPSKKVILYTGDGSFGFNAIEIDTAIRHNVDFKIVIHNDGQWGICKATQNMLYESNAAVELNNMHYELWVEGMGGKGYFIEDPKELDEKMEEFMNAEGVACLNAIVDSHLYAPGTEKFLSLLEEMK